LEELIAEEARKRQAVTQLKGRHPDGSPMTSVLENSLKPSNSDAPSLVIASRGTIASDQFFLVPPPFQDPLPTR